MEQSPRSHKKASEGGRKACALRVFTTDVGAARFYGMGNRLKVDLKYQSPSRDWAGIEAWAVEVDLGIFPTVWRQKRGALLRVCAVNRPSMKVIQYT